MTHEDLVRLIAAGVADAMEDDGLQACIPGLAELSGHSVEQLSIAAASPRGSLGRAWLLSMIDGYAGEASKGLGRITNWQETVRFHRERRGQ